MILFCISFLLVLIYYWYTRNFKYWKSKNVPFEPPFLFLGNFFKILSREQHIFQRIREIYENFKTPYVGIYIFNQPYLIVRNPELIKRILVKDFDKFVNRKVASNEDVDPIAAHTLFSAKDQIWKNLRSRISPVFTSGKMKLMLPLIKECASDLIQHLENHNGQEVRLRHVTKKYAVDIISSCAFGIHSYCLKDQNSDILKVATNLLDFTSWKRSFSVFSFFFAPRFVNMFRLTFLDQDSAWYLVNVFKKTINERKNKKIVRHDLIEMLNQLRQNESFNDGYMFDDTKMAAQALAFFSAGNETTSLTVALTLYELGLNAKIQERLRQEIITSFEADGDFSYETIQNMKYLDMVLNETLRKYPLTSFLNREVNSDYQFEKYGFTLEKGLALLIPIAGLHYDPEYFPNPEKYDPERFSDDHRSKIVPYTFLPFGDGPRNCIGQRFGILVSKVALVYCVKHFAFERSENTLDQVNLDPRSMFITDKGEFPLRIFRI